MNGSLSTTEVFTTYLDVVRKFHKGELPGGVYAQQCAMAQAEAETLEELIRREDAGDAEATGFIEAFIVETDAARLEVVR